ncbi:MAG: methyl-accepting chemotaxis protein [Leptospiraceae bacterium]|nr:methyl-accepting chemotaxis protein [Leptospiraceae bacterium]
MTIRLQNLLFLVPVFLIAGLLIGGLKWAADTTTLESGGREQIRTFAVAIQEFLQAREQNGQKKGLASIDPDALQRDLSRVQQLFDLREPEITTSSISRLLWPDETSRAGAPGLVIMDPSGDEIIFASAPESFPGDIGEAALLQVSEKGAMALIRNTEVWIPDFSASLYSPEQLWAFTSLKNDEGKEFALLGVQYDGTWIRNEVRASIIEIVIGILVAVLAGIVISLFLSFILARSIRGLTEAASRAAEGDYEVRIKKGIIEEFNDLGNTFRTMTSLLYDTLDRIRKTLIEQEQFRNTDDLMATFRARAYETVDVEEDWMEARMGPLRSHLPGYFYHDVKKDQGHLFLMGWVHDSSEPDDLVASAICRYVEGRINLGEDPLKTLDSVFQLFSARKILALHIQPNPAHGKLYMLDSEHTGTEAKIEEFGSVPENGLVFHTLGEAFGSRIDTALRHMERGTAASIHEQIRAIAMPGEDGIVLFIRGHR